MFLEFCIGFSENKRSEGLCEYVEFYILLLNTK